MLVPPALALLGLRLHHSLDDLLSIGVVVAAGRFPSLLVRARRTCGLGATRDALPELPYGFGGSALGAALLSHIFASGFRWSFSVC